MPNRQLPDTTTPRRERRSRRATRIAFGVIVVFVLTQAAWWLLFEFRSIEQATTEKLAAWQRDAAFANAVMAQVAGDPASTAALRARILADYPHLMLARPAARTPASGPDPFAVDPAHRQAFLAAQRGHRRMFAFEGPAFALVVLSMLLFIAGSLRSERELKRRQQNFLSAVTHEFKTPISTLRLLVQTALMRTLPPAKQRDYLTRMETELDRLERTSEQVLASARLEQSAAGPELAAAELNHLVQGIVGRARGGLEARGATLAVDYSPEALPVSVDPDGLAVVLNNLLDNAVKYSPGGRKPVRVGLERRGDVVEIHVDDEGIGLKPGEERAVFGRFYRVGDEMTRESTGVGLGLHLVRSISEAMNGWVKAGANPNAAHGSRFTIVLPRRLGPAADEARAQRSSLAASAEGGTP